MPGGVAAQHGTKRIVVRVRSASVRVAAPGARGRHATLRGKPPARAPGEQHAGDGQRLHLSLVDLPWSREVSRTRRTPIPKCDRRLAPAAVRKVYPQWYEDTARIRNGPLGRIVWVRPQGCGSLESWAPPSAAPCRWRCLSGDVTAVAAAMGHLFDPAQPPCPRLARGLDARPTRFAPAFDDLDAPSQIFLARGQGFDAVSDPFGSDGARGTCGVGPKSVDAALEGWALPPIAVRSPTFLLRPRKGSLRCRTLQGPAPERIRAMPQRNASTPKPDASTSGRRRGCFARKADA